MIPPGTAALGNAAVRPLVTRVNTSTKHAFRGWRDLGYGREEATGEREELRR